jgi:hypothetical protein
MIMVLMCTLLSELLIEENLSLTHVYLEALCLPVFAHICCTALVKLSLGVRAFSSKKGKIYEKTKRIASSAFAKV